VSAPADSLQWPGRIIMLHERKQKTILPFPQIFVVTGFTVSETRENPWWLLAVRLSPGILATPEPVPLIWQTNAVWGSNGCLQMATGALAYPSR